MHTKRDVIFSFGFALVSVILTVVICLTNNYIVIPTNAPKSMIIEHMMFDDSNIFLSESSQYSAVIVSTTFSSIWLAIFLPMFASIPFLLLFASELKGLYRMKILRMGSFSKYWNKTFFRAGLSGAGCVTIGYIIFSAMVFSYFPHMYEYPEEADILADSISQLAVRRELSSIFNRLFNNTQSEFLYWLPKVINVFGFTFLVSVMCLALYLLIMNQYKAIGIPIISFYLLEQVSARLTRKTLNPKFIILSPRYNMSSADYVFEQFGAKSLWYLVFFALMAIILYLLGRALFRKKVLN